MISFFVSLLYKKKLNFQVFFKVVYVETGWHFVSVLCLFVCLLECVTSRKTNSPDSFC